MSLLPDLARRFAEAHPDEAAQILERLPLQEITPYLQDVEPSSAAKVLQQIMPAVAGPCLVSLPRESRNAIMAALPIDLAARLIRSLEVALQKSVLEQIPESLAKSLRPLLAFPSETAGALMDPRIAGWPSDMNVSEALERMRANSYRVVDYLYIVDREGRLVGVVSYWDLATIDPQNSLGSVMQPNVDHLMATAPKKSILVHPAWRRFHALPVTDQAGRFLGVLRYKTLRQLEGELAGEMQNPVHTFLALGELCWTGMTAVWDTMTTVTTETKSQKSKP